MEELIKEIYQLKQQKKDLEKEQEDIKSKVNTIDTEIEGKQKLLLEKMKASDKKVVDLGDIVAETFSKENISYKDDKDVLKYLKDYNYTSLITTKITESINKNNLKKELKTNETLRQALDSMTVKSITEWVVVTDKENHTKMLEHIEDNK